MNSDHAQFLIPEDMAGRVRLAGKQPAFGGRKASPFKSDGGRKPATPRDAKGNPKKK